MKNSLDHMLLLPPPVKHEFVVKIDFREGESGIADILEQTHKAKVLRQVLKTGDYIINDSIVVERKTAIDFVQSIIDGRLFAQASRMTQSFESCALIIEGNNLFDTHFDMHSHAIKGALVSLSLIWHVPVLFSENPDATALLLSLIGKQHVQFKSALSFRYGRRPKRLGRQQLYILQGLPSVGPKLAQELLNHFGSIEKVINASVEELTEVPHLGKVKAVKIKKVISAEISHSAEIK